uniref:Cytochrome b5 heme-binding domain-containing protein n=3 Tax=Parascaris univalens TaxID=6257 RepID=A0A915BF90_PARUN
TDYVTSQLIAKMGESSKEVGDREITVDEVAKHNTATSLWIIYNDKVLDLTEFLNEHPGGDQVLLEVAGQDGTSRFRDIQHSTDAIEMTEQYVIGSVKKDTSSLKRTSVPQ